MEGQRTQIAGMKEALAVLGLNWKVYSDKYLSFDYSPDPIESHLRMQLRPALSSEQEGRVTLLTETKVTEFDSSTADIVEDLRPAEEPSLMIVYDARQKSIRVNYMLRHDETDTFLPLLRDAMEKLYDLSVRLKGRLIERENRSVHGKKPHNSKRISKLQKKSA